MRLGVVGAGVVGRLRAEAAGRTADLMEVAAVVDVDLAAAQRLARRSGATAFRDLAAALDAAALDAVVISTPTPLHAEQVSASLAAGLHVLCEKPLAADPPTCRRLVAEAAAADRVLAVGFDYRYFSAVRFMSEVLAAGSIGELDHVRAYGGHDGLGNFRGSWMYAADEAGGGAAMDIGLHLTDTLRHLFGELEVVAARASNRVWKVPGSEDQAVALLSTRDGVPVSYEASWSEWLGFRFAISAYGTQGMVAARYAPMYSVCVRRDEAGSSRREQHRYLGAIVRERLFGWESTTRRAFASELRDLHARIQGGTVGLATGEDGSRAVELASEMRAGGALE